MDEYVKVWAWEHNIQLENNMTGCSWFCVSEM